MAELSKENEQKDQKYRLDYEEFKIRGYTPKEFDEAVLEKLYCRYVTTRNLMFYFAGITIGIIISAYLRGD